MKLILKFFDWFEEIAMVIGLAIMVIVNFLNVIFRYLLPQSPLSYTEELTVLMFVWITMLGIGCGYKRHAHTGLTLITDLLPKAVQRVFILVSMMASLIFLVYLFYWGADMVKTQINFGQIMTALKIPEACQGLAIPVGTVFIIIRVIHTGIVDFINFGRESDPNKIEPVEGEA